MVLFGVGCQYLDACASALQGGARLAVWVYACLQEKKQLVFEGTVGRDVEALTRLTEDDLRFLFS